MKSLKSSDYTIYIENSLQELQKFLLNNNYSKVFFLVDTNTEQHCLPVVRQILPDLQGFDIIEIDPGEENKNIDFCIGIWRMLLDFGADRNSLLINLGGGVVTDMGSFAAATFKRGIDFVQVPTTLLSQVDASVGGKTGIDMNSVKNIIGTFTQPKAVFINPDFLKTLDERQLTSGFAEMIKHGLVYDESYFEQLQTITPRQITPDIIYRSVEIKNEVVLADPYEKGLRKILNFGHTIGHAIESYSLKNDSDPLLHGEAIAIGMICEAYLSHTINGLSKNDLIKIQEILLTIFPHYTFKPLIYPQLIEYMHNDKKNLQNNIGFSLLRSIGKCDYHIFIPEKDIKSSLDFYNDTLNETI